MKITKEQFKETKFMSKLEKYQIAKHFKRFVENGFKLQDFNKKVYEHLHLHNGFIAHYNINGFYHEYFNGNKNDLKRFVESLINVNGLTFEDKYNYSNVSNNANYGDLNKVLADILIENNIQEQLK